MVRRRSAKLTPGAAPPVAISVAGLRAAAGLESEETPFAALLAHALSRQPGFVVLERQRLLALAQEKELGPDLGAPFWASRMLLGGAIEHDPQTPGGVLVKARLQPREGAAIELSVQGPRVELGNLARELARRTAEALKQPPVAIAWDAGAEAGRFMREARAALAVGLWDLAESAGGAAWALGYHGADLAQLRYRIQLERLLNANRMSAGAASPFLRTMANASPVAECEWLGQRRTGQYPQEPYLDFRFPEDLAGARRLLDLYWTWMKIAPPPARGNGMEFFHQSGALMCSLASLPLVLVHRQSDPAAFAPQMEALKADLADTLPRLLEAGVKRAGPAALTAARNTADESYAARGLQQLRYVQGFSAVFQAGNADAWRAALPVLLAEEVKGDPMRLQLRTGLLKGQAVAALYVQATWPRDVFHEIGLTRPKDAAPDDRLLALAMLDGARLDPAARHATAAAFPEAMWALRDSYVRHTDATRAYVEIALQRFQVGRMDMDEWKALVAAVRDARRRLFLYVASHSPQDQFDPQHLWSELEILRWTPEEAAAFNDGLRARIGEIEQRALPEVGSPYYAGQLSSRKYDVRRVMGWQAEVRARFPSLPVYVPPAEEGPALRPRAPLQVTRFWNPYLATKLVPAEPAEGFRILSTFTVGTRLWLLAELALPRSRPSNASTVRRVFFVEIEPRSGETKVIEVPNIGHVNEWQPYGASAVSQDFIVLMKFGIPPLKWRRDTGEWKPYEQFTTTRLPVEQPEIVGHEAFVSLSTEIVRWNLETDAVSTLVRTRREPAESPLDSPQHTRVWPSKGQHGELVINGKDDSIHSVSYRFAPGTNQWEKRTFAQENEDYDTLCVIDPAAHEKWESPFLHKVLKYFRLPEGGPTRVISCAIPLAFVISEKDHAALQANERISPGELQALEKSLQSTTQGMLQTPDGLIFASWETPGFWFIPKEDLAAYVAAHGMAADPQPTGIFPPTATPAPKAKETKP
jgi:hypothetical protein